MEDIQKLNSYADLRRLVSPEAFTATMNYLTWHNRLKMTAMLPVWQALVIGFLCDQRPIDNMLYSSIKAFLAGNKKLKPGRVDDCRKLAGELAAHLAGTS
jgi:hypothetical protein